MIVMRRMVAILCLVALVAACAGADSADTTESESADTTADDGAAAEGSAAEVFDMYNSMTGQERHDALVAAAQEEGAVVIYTTAPGYDPAFDAFADTYGIEVEKFVGRSDTVLQRVSQELEAGLHYVDIVEDEFSRLLVPQGVTYPYVNDGLTQDLIGYDPEWQMVPFRLSVPAVNWNTDLVSDDEVPETLLDLVDPAWAGRMVLDAGAFDWYATVRTWLIDDQGFTEEEADEYFETLVANGLAQPTSIAMTQLIGAGEYALGVQVLTFVTDLNKSNGAPVDWRTSDGRYVSPVVVAPEGGVLMANAPHPAAALLLMDFMIGEGAPLLQENHWPSPTPTKEGFTLEGVNEEDLLLVDPAVMTDDREQWSSAWDALITGG